MQPNPNSKEIQAETVLELMETSEEKGLLTTNNGMVHILSMSWFEKWKKYTNFESIRAKKSKSKANNVEDLNDEDEIHIHPGPINQDDILLSTKDLLIDLEPSEESCNYVIKNGLVENRHFIIVSHLVWCYLANIYGGKDIRRYVYNPDQSRASATIEVWLKKVSFL